MDITETKKQINLILEFSKNELKLKYSNTSFGYLWSMINPILLLITLYVVFTYVMDLNLPNYQFFLLIGIIAWNFFSEATNKSFNFLFSNKPLMKQHKVNPILFVISSCLSSLVDLFLSLTVFFWLVIIFNLNISIFLILVSIIYFFFLFFLTLGVSLIISGIYINFKDIKHLWSFFLLILFWLSPIIYSESILAPSVRRFYLLNPLARIISHLRNALIYQYFDPLYQILITLILSLSVFLFGLWVFNILSENIVEKL